MDLADVMASIYTCDEIHLRAGHNNIIFMIQIHYTAAIRLVMRRNKCKIEREGRGGGERE